MKHYDFWNHGINPITGYKIISDKALHYQRQKELKAKGTKIKMLAEYDFG